MRYSVLLLLVGSFVACAPKSEDIKPVVEKTSAKTKHNSVEEIMIGHIESKLNINAIEKYEIEIFKEELNHDDSTDWIVSVNLLDRALNQAAATNRIKQMEAVGYMGQFNYIFFMDGKTKKFSPAVVIPSSAYAKLIVEFDYITSTTNKDFTVDLKIKNSRRRRFYTIQNNIPLQICEEVIYYNYGKEGAELRSSVIRFEDSNDSPFKDIAVYNGDLKQKVFDSINDIYLSDPKISSTGKMIRRWYFDPRSKKYYMKKGEF